MFRSAGRYTINQGNDYSPFFNLNAEIRASLVSERVGHLGFDVSINNKLIIILAIVCRLLF